MMPFVVGTAVCTALVVAFCWSHLRPCMQVRCTAEDTQRREAEIKETLRKVEEMEADIAQRERELYERELEVARAEAEDEGRKDEIRRGQEVCQALPWAAGPRGRETLSCLVGFLRPVCLLFCVRVPEDWHVLAWRTRWVSHTAPHPLPPQPPSQPYTQIHHNPLQPYTLIHHNPPQPDTQTPHKPPQPPHPAPPQSTTTLQPDPPQPTTALPTPRPITALETHCRPLPQLYTTLFLPFPAKNEHKTSCIIFIVQWSGDRRQSVQPRDALSHVMLGKETM